MNKYDLAVFDLDGTLLDTLGDLADSANQVLREWGLPEHPEAAYKKFVGDGVRALMFRCLPEKQREDNQLLEKAVEQVRHIYSCRWHCRTAPYDGVNEMLAKLREKQIPMAVLSNKPDDFTQIVTDYFFPDQPFAVVQGQNEEIPPKPDPTGARAICRELSSLPEKTIYLGDTNTDMQTAINAGFFPIGACWGFRDAQELTDNGARSLIEHPLDLVSLI